VERTRIRQERRLRVIKHRLHSELEVRLVGHLYTSEEIITITFIATKVNGKHKC
jgi:hypothetical protein